MRRTLPAIIVLLALGAFLGGCDSDPAPALKIGFIVAGERPTYLRSAQLAVDELNAHGGLLGRPVELVSLVNTEASLPLSVQTAEAMIVDDRVIAIIGPNRSTHAVEVGPIAQRHGVPMVTTAASNPRVTDAGEFVFMASVTDTFQGRVMAQFATADLGVRTVALLTLRGDVYTEGISEFFAANFEDLGGTVVADEFFDAETTDFTEQLAAIADLKPDAFFISSFIQGFPTSPGRPGPSPCEMRRGSRRCFSEPIPGTARFC